MLWQGIHRGGGKEFLDGVANLELLAFGEGGEIVEDRLTRFRSEPGNINSIRILPVRKMLELVH